MILTLTGSNSFLLQQELNRLISEFTSKHGNLGLEKIDGEEVTYERLSEAIQTLPFLVDRKLLIVRNPGLQKGFAEQVEALLKLVPNSTDIIIVEPKIDRRSSYFKVLKAQTTFKEYTETDANKLNTWIVQYVKDQKGHISLQDASYLVERVGLNQQILANELDKLMTYNPTITHQTIDLLTDPTPQSTIFELIDSAFAGNDQKTLELYRQQRTLKVEPQQIMAMIGWQLHVLAITKTAGDKSVSEIASQAKLNPFVVRKTSAIAQRISLKQLKELIRRALDLDVRLKSQAIDPDEALQHFLLTIS